MKGFRKLLVGLLLGLVLAALLAGAAGCGPSGPKEIVVADIEDLSGPGAGWGKLGKVAVDITVGDINAAGGITVGGDKYTLRAINYDHQYDPGIGATVARKAIYDDKVKAILSWDRPIIDAYYDLAAQQKVTIIGMVSTGELGAKYPWLFNAFYRRADMLAVLYDYLGQKQPGAKVSGAYYDDEEAYETNTMRQQFASKAGLQDLGSTYFAGDTTDFYPVLTTILAKKPEIIDISGVTGETLGLLVKQARELGYKGAFAYAGTPGLDEAAGIAGWNALEGYLGAGEFTEFPTAVGKSFMTRYSAATGGDQSPWPAYWYDSLWLLKLAFEKANSLDMEKVNKAMETIAYEGTKGTIRYGGEATMGLSRQMIEQVPVIEVKGGKRVQVYLAVPKGAK
ncbi:MAG: ABC transporter substrate-binding protein [Chloroflexi bacterium]|nr:ABC transporter substrate-binding protein [Chloroflexota bacterium]